MAMKSQTQRTFLLAFITAIVCCGVLGVYCLLLGHMGPVEARVLASTAVVGAASILGMVSALPWERRRWHPIGPVAAAAVALAFMLLLIMVWAPRGLRNWETLFKITVVACVAGVAFPHIALLSLARLRRQYEWVRLAVIVLVVILFMQISFMVLAERHDDHLFRMLGILAIGDVCGTIAVPLLHRMSAIRHRESVQTTELVLSLTCPRCAKTQELPAGRSKCVGCGLKFNVEIEEEHCRVCGYSLYRLESTACLECGTPVAGHPAPVKP